MKRKAQEQGKCTLKESEEKVKLIVRLKNRLVPAFYKHQQRSPNDINCPKSRPD